MPYKLKEIREKLPKITTLPDGLYYGIWRAYIIDVNYKGKSYELVTEEGVRGIGVKVVVTISNNVVTFETINN